MEHMDTPTASRSSMASSPREIFLHLFTTVALYVSAVALGQALFAYINIAFPDVLSNDVYGINNYRHTLRWAIASIVVAFPAFFIASRTLYRWYATSVTFRDARIRKWLIYITLFVAALTIGGDLIVLVSNVLGGEYTIRFVLKVATILLIAGSVCWYYLWDLQKSVPPSRVARWCAIGFVAVVVVVAFILAGSPQSERFRAFDSERVNHLQMIQGEILSFWQYKDRLPENLAEITDPIRGFAAPIDPETSTPYRYEVVDPLTFTFKLCATFTAPSDSYVGTLEYRVAKPVPAPFFDGGVGVWEHGSGETCFVRTIDPERYSLPKG
jgi:hypothetical protein